MGYLHQPRHLRITNQLISAYFGFSAGSVLLLACLMCGCASHQASTAATPQFSPAAQEPTKTAPPPTPTLAEVNEAVTRVFKDAVTIDSNRDPSFLAGDFNGDSSQDIAVIVQPTAGKLAEINQESPPWILRDLSADATRPAQPLQIATGEFLLAIIHGYGPNGWRDKEATQTYLLKNAVGAEVRAWPKDDFANAGEGKKLPRLVGDLIGENLRGKPGYLYFNGALYSWYDPKTFRGQSEARLTHPGMMTKKKIDLLHPNLVAAEK